MIPVSIIRLPVIIKWGNHSTLNIPTVAECLSEQLNVKFTLINPFCNNGTTRYENRNQSCFWPISGFNPKNAEDFASQCGGGGGGRSYVPTDKHRSM